MVVYCLAIRDGRFHLGFTTFNWIMSGNFISAKDWQSTSFSKILIIMWKTLSYRLIFRTGIFFTLGDCRCLLAFLIKLVQIIFSQTLVVIYELSKRPSMPATRKKRLGYFISENTNNTQRLGFVHFNSVGLNLFSTYHTIRRVVFLQFFISV